MLQKNTVVRDYIELEKKIPEIEEFFSNYDYQDGVVEVFVGNIPEDDIPKILALLNSKFPRMKVLGFSVVQQAIILNMDSCIVLNFTAMSNAGAELFFEELDIDKINYVEPAFSYAKGLNKKIKAMKDVKAIEIFISCIKGSVAKFLEILTEGIEDIPVFGAIAAGNDINNVRNSFSVGNEDSFVIGGTKYSPGVVGVIFSGNDLYVYEDYLFGWEPVGRYMDVNARTITDQDTTVITCIDGMKPIDIYRKYLGVEANEYLISNIGEFPLVIERNGVLIGRTPSSFGDEGEIYLEGDLLEGEKVRFSYAEVKNVLDGTRYAASRMDSFGAERLSLIICGNRFHFLQDDALLEIECYSEGRETAPNVILGMGEIYMYKGKGGVLNSALVAIGMREGLQGEILSPILPPKTINHDHNIIPLSERLSHFLKAMTGELVEAVHDAEAANSAKSEFLSNMSHEIRTPINAVLGMDEMILRESDDPQIQEYAHNIKKAGNTLISLVNDILDFSKIEAGGMDIIPVDYDLSSVLNDLVHMAEPRIAMKGLTFTVNADKSMPSIVNGDEVRVKQVITNLLSNAIKYTEEGGITMSVTYKKASEDMVDFFVSVKDTGIGIKKEDIEKLFDAFKRVDEKRNRAIQGTGLGLNITRRLLELMGTELRVKSEYGKGSEFSFVLRQKVVNWDPAGDYMESYRRALLKMEAYKEKFTAPRAEILVVDDTPVNISVFTGLLKKTLVKIDEALSGKQCLEMTEKKKYDLIFLDHRMPDMDGIETLEKLRSEKDNPNNDTPVISVTANAVSGAREQYIKAGFIDYLTKPIMSDKLETMMIKYLPQEKVNIVKVEDFEEEKDEKLPEWIGKVEGINKEDGLKNCGSSEMYLKTLETFATSASEGKRAIEEFFKAENIADYTIKVHSLKSSARIIGATELSKLAESLEKAGDMKDMETIKKDTPRLLSMYKKLHEDLKKLGESSDESLPPMDENKLKEAFLSIKELATTFDYDGIKYIIDSISSHKVPDNRKEIVVKLKDAIRNADWDKIKVTLDEF